MTLSRAIMARDEAWSGQMLLSTAQKDPNWRALKLEDDIGNDHESRSRIAAGIKLEISSLEG